MSDYLFIASDYKPQPGGIAAYVDALARGLITAGNRVRLLAVVSPEEESRLAFLQTYEDWVIPFPVVRDERPNNWIANKIVSVLEIVRCLSPTARLVLDRTPIFRSSAEAVTILRQIVTKDKPEMIVFGHLDLNLYPFVLLLSELHLPYGIIAHDVEIGCSPSRRNDVVRRGLMLQGAKWIAANSSHTRSLLEPWGIESNKIVVIHPPICSQAIRESAQVSSRLKARSFTLITICRLVRSKGIDTILQALKILDERNIPFRYVVVGKGEECEHLRSLATQLKVDNRVWFAGHVTEACKWSLLRSADLFVMTSRVDAKEHHEGFGIAFLEAAAFGLPAVGSRAGGIPEAVVDGTTGILVEPESPEKLAEALIVMYRDPDKRREMGLAGMHRAKSRFSPEAIAACFHEEVWKRMSMEDSRDRGC